VNALAALNPTPNPGLEMSFRSAAPGSWRVAYAPHIRRLSSVLGTRFDPIRYILSGDGGVVSNVKYDSSIFGRGWLSASGSYGSIDATDTRISFDKFWWKILGGNDASPGTGPDDGDFSSLVQGIGSKGFGTCLCVHSFGWSVGRKENRKGSRAYGFSARSLISPSLFLLPLLPSNQSMTEPPPPVPALSRFPVAYLDDDTCIFSFPPLNVKITARKEPW
jgi:hypothetical protein